MFGLLGKQSATQANVTLIMVPALKPWNVISLICIICKILESIIRDQMLEIFKQKNTIYTYISDFTRQIMPSSIVILCS